MLFSNVKTGGCHDALAEEAFGTGAGGILFRGFPLSLRVFRGFLDVLGVEFVTNGVTGVSKWMNSMLNEGKMLTGVGSGLQSCVRSGGGNTVVGLAGRVEAGSGGMEGGSGLVRVSIQAILSRI